MAQTENRIINHWSFLAFAREFGADFAKGECVNHETGETFQACTFTKDGNRTFVGIGKSLDKGMSLQEIVAAHKGLQVVQLDNGNYILCKVGESTWETVDLKGLM